MRGASSPFPLGCAALGLVLGACGGEGAAPLDPADPDTAQAVSAIEIVPPQQFLGGLGRSKQILALALAEGDSVLYGDSERFSWSSSAPDVVTVDGKGLITSVGWGTATVTASHEGVAATTPVIVRDAIRLAWSVPIAGGIAGIVMGSDGTIYVGTNDWATNSSAWHAVSPEGGVLWTLPLPYTEGTPAIGEDGTLYISSWFHDSGGRLIAVDPGGTVRWVLEDLDRIRTSPALGPDGTVYVAAHHYVYAVDPRGEIEWSYEGEDDIFLFSSPGIASDGTLYVGGEDGRLYALDPDGTLLWTFATEDRIRSSPSIGPDGTIYVGSHDGRLYAVHPDGTERWSVELHCGLPWGCLDVKGSPSIGPDGTTYVMADAVYAVDPAGSIRWRYPVANQSGSPRPTVAADGTLYVANSYLLVDGNGKGMIFALDPQGRLLWEHRTEDHAGGPPIIGLDGTIIAAAGDDLLAIVENGG